MSSDVALTPEAGAPVARQPERGIPHVVVTLGGRRLAVPMAALAAVADLGEVTTLPLTPAWLLGVSNLRGSVVPVVDLATLLGWPPGRSGQRALVLRDGRFALAAPIDAVHAVRWLELPSAAAPPAALVRHEVTIDEWQTYVVSAEAVLARVRQGEQIGSARR